MAPPTHTLQPHWRRSPIKPQSTASMKWYLTGPVRVTGHGARIVLIIMYWINILAPTIKDISAVFIVHFHINSDLVRHNSEVKLYQNASNYLWWLNSFTQSYMNNAWICEMRATKINAVFTGCYCHCFDFTVNVMPCPNMWTNQRSPQSHTE